MKYSEFRVEVEGIGLHIGVYDLNIDVVDKHGDTVGCIAKDVEMSMDTDFEDFRKLPKEKKIVVFESLYELAKTPLAEREEEKLYRVKFPSITRWGSAVYLQKDTSDKDPIGVDWSPEDFIFYEEPTDYIFTEQEIKDIDERYLAFKVEVTE